MKALRIGQRIKFRAKIGEYGTFTRTGKIADFYSRGAIVTLNKDLPGYLAGNLIRVENHEIIR